jgi:hypothetical protein
MMEYDPRQQAQLGPYYNYSMGGTQGGFMGNAGGLAGSLFNLAQGLPSDEQGPSQGPNTLIRYYDGMGYGPVGPAGGGLPPAPTPMASMYGGPQFGQADPYPAAAAGFLNKRVS